MADSLELISRTARQAVQRQDWNTVAICANEILSRQSTSAEGHFLKGLVHKASSRPVLAAQSFEQALEFDSGRYDAAVELADQYSTMRRNGDAAALLAKYEPMLSNSPRYLDLAGTVYNDIGLPERGLPLYEKANELQPGIDLFQANLAACCVYAGRIDQAKALYEKLLTRFPGHRRNHHQLARLARARDDRHVEQMKRILGESREPPDHEVFLYFAIAKELEDLERWDEAFDYYRMAGDAVTSVADYDVDADIELIDTIIRTCSREWIEDRASYAAPSPGDKVPLFIVGLPRTGTTLTERILSSHSSVESLGETQFLQMALRRESGIASVEPITPEMIEALATKEMAAIARGYLDAVAYRLGEKPIFIEKLPFNFNFLGFIAKAFPEGRIVHLRRNPMDACFSMYKQVFTWAYKFSYSLDNLGQYYIAYERLLKHWREVLGERLIDVEYEALVADQEGQTRRLLDRLGLPFEEACLDFEQNRAPSTTASSVQVRERVYDTSVGRWKRFAVQLQPLRDRLEGAGIAVG